MPGKAKQQNDEDAKVAAEAVEQEAKAEPAETVTIEFRGEKFDVPRSVVSDARWNIALASNRYGEVVADLIPTKDYVRFIGLVQRGEDIFTVAREALDALSSAVRVGKENGSSDSPSS